MKLACINFNKRRTNKTQLYDYTRLGQVFNEVVADIGESEGVSLYPKTVSLATLSSKHSRHTTPTAAHHVMDAVSKHLPKNGNSAVVVVSHSHLQYLLEIRM